MNLTAHVGRILPSGQTTTALTAREGSVLKLNFSLRDLRVLCVSAVNNSLENAHRRVAENAEIGAENFTPVVLWSDNRAVGVPNLFDLIELLRLYYIGEFFRWSRSVR